MCAVNTRAMRNVRVLLDFVFSDGDVAETQQIKIPANAGGCLLWIETKCRFGEGASCSPYLSLCNASL